MEASVSAATTEAAVVAYDGETERNNDCSIVGGEDSNRSNYSDKSKCISSLFGEAKDTQDDEEEFVVPKLEPLSPPPTMMESEQQQHLDDVDTTSSSSCTTQEEELQQQKQQQPKQRKRVVKKVRRKRRRISTNTAEEEASEEAASAEVTGKHTNSQGSAKERRQRLRKLQKEKELQERHESQEITNMLRDLQKQIQEEQEAIEMERLRELEEMNEREPYDIVVPSDDSEFVKHARAQLQHAKSRANVGRGIRQSSMNPIQRVKDVVTRSWNPYALRLPKVHEFIAAGVTLRRACELYPWELSSWSRLLEIGLRAKYMTRENGWLDIEFLTGGRKLSVEVDNESCIRNQLLLTDDVHQHLSTEIATQQKTLLKVSFDVTGRMLHRDCGFTVQHILALKLQPVELVRLSLKMQDLVEMGITREQFLAFGHFSDKYTLLEVWILQLELRASHLTKHLYLSPYDYYYLENSCGWNLDVLRHHLGLREVYSEEPPIVVPEDFVMLEVVEQHQQQQQQRQQYYNNNQPLQNQQQQQPQQYYQYQHQPQQQQQQHHPVPSFAAAATATAAASVRHDHPYLVTGDSRRVYAIGTSPGDRLHTLTTMQDSEEEEQDNNDNEQVQDWWQQQQQQNMQPFDSNSSSSSSSNSHDNRQYVSSLERYLIECTKMAERRQQQHHQQQQQQVADFEASGSHNKRVNLDLEDLDLEL
mgnify:FL=1